MTIHECFTRKKLALAISLSCAVATSSAYAEDVVAIDEVVVTADKMGLMNEKAKSVFGFDKSILETPRSVTSVSSTMMESYAITDTLTINFDEEN